MVFVVTLGFMFFKNNDYIQYYSRWLFELSVIFSPVWGKISNLTHIFQMG